MKPAIRFVIITYTSARDVNGNCYHYAQIISTLTNKRLWLNVGGDRNAHSLVSKVTADYSMPIINEQVTLPKKTWKAKVSNIDLYEHTPGIDLMIRNLEKS